MAENLALRALISQQTDALVSELYTDDKVNARLQTWLAKVPDPGVADTYSYLLSESRDFSEELLYRILTKLVEDGSLKLNEQA
ncbi:hypothetical protein EQH89_07735 [Lacticaseibacillus paracasei]|uniref:hypothetical protein n=1 Tax=Lacticaseibacillus paracasei TaxID=1597 RepID=UPI000FF17D54|nr:hypothetical protein [Lacticaseibacillus paracasei]RWZ62962.1 hypothetical protein EQH89_07735 [Lacticaseibacillus paracasei]